MLKFFKTKKLRNESKEILNKKVKIKKIKPFKAPEVNDDNYQKCKNCTEIVQTKKIVESMYSCPKCNFLFRLNPQQRIDITFDSFDELFKNEKQTNPLNIDFYDKKLKSAKSISKQNSAITTGVATIEDQKFAAFVMNHEFIMGSMGTVVGEKICKLFQYATKHKLSVVGFTASGGARMQEAMFSLIQMVRTSAAVANFQKAGKLYMPILTTPTYGGVSASFAMLGDIIMAEEKAMIGFAGKKVIKDAMNIDLPEGFQTAEFLLEKGFIDLISSREYMKENIYKILSMHSKKRGK